jgi:hypothetical protein
VGIKTNTYSSPRDGHKENINISSPRGGHKDKYISPPPGVGIKTNIFLLPQGWAFRQRSNIYLLSQGWALRKIYIPSIRGEHEDKYISPPTRVGTPEKNRHYKLFFHYCVNRNLNVSTKTNFAV